MSAFNGVTSISAIVPIGPGDQLSNDFVELLKGPSWLYEVLFVATRPANLLEQEFVSELSKSIKTQWLISRPGRAEQQNCGASVASGVFLWFLHIDSRAGWKPHQLDGFIARLSHGSAYFFDLGFYGKSVRRMRVNAFGVWLRSHIFKMPFGDQALLIPRAAFEKLGGFDQKLVYGEDHVLIWRLRQHGFAVRPIGARIMTSSRKYDQRGWGKTTWLHLRLTYLQAWPEFWKWMWGKT